MNVKYGIQNEFRIFYLIHCRMRKMGMTKKNQVMPDKVLSKEFEEDRIGIFTKDLLTTGENQTVNRNIYQFRFLSIIIHALIRRKNRTGLHHRLLSIRSPDVCRPCSHGPAIQ